MKRFRSLPIPFLILILAGVVSLYSLIATRSSGAAMAQGDSLQMQTVEQDRVAAIYFQVLSWLSDVNARTSKPAHAKPQPASVPQMAHHPRSSECRVIIELCTFHPSRKLAISEAGAHIWY